MATTDTAVMISKIRVRLIVDQPFWGQLALGLKIVEKRGIDTIATDGTSLFYNPAFVEALNVHEQDAVMAHEILHCAMLHMFRRGGRDMKRWNIACDYAINPMLLDAGFQLPMSWKDPRTGAVCKPLVDMKYKGMSAEQIYALLPPDEGRGKDAGKPSPTGTVMDAPEPGNGPKGDDPGEPGDGPGGDEPGDGSGNDHVMTEADWQTATLQAAMTAQAKKAGSIPGSILEQIKASRDARIDWRAVLSQFVTQTLVSDTAWSRPNRRFVGRGMYLPGVVRENTGKMVVGVDSSGSVTSDMLKDFAAEITGILHTARPEEIDVVYCDTRVNGTQTFTPDDTEITLECKGRGGTALQPVFDWIAKSEKEPPVCIIYLTDLESNDTPKDPGIPTLWITPDGSRLNGPFGTTIRIPAN